ncbi:hypothetical protein SCLCIDRAFT_122082, partial [Scleroderma citrinum Foug A]
LRKLAYKIVNSSTIILPAWKEMLINLCKTISLMPQYVATQWNSTLDLLEYALKHQEVVDLITQRRELGLRTFELTDNEWGVLEQLHSILKDATLYFSCSTPNLATVIPVMDHIHQELSKYSHDKKYVCSICAGVSLAKETLNRYYLCTDETKVYRIAMGKLDLFTFVAIN